MRWTVAAIAALLCLLAVVPAGATTTDASVVLDETAYCASLGRKQPGEAADATMADHIADAFAAGGLTVTREEFHLPVYEVEDVAIEVLAPASDAGPVPGDSFTYGGTGVVEAEVVYVGVGRAEDYAGVDAAGKIVMVDRELTFHRSAQLNEVVAHGGAAMLYVSAAPDNLVQVGTVRFAQHPRPDIPTVTVGADDGAALQALAEAGGLVMRVQVDATVEDAVGVNVLGTRTGTTYPDQYILVGGHYDSWYDGAVDNCSAIGTMLHMVDAMADVEPAYTIVYGAWDAEEVGLVGSYDWVMRHQDIIGDVVVNQNLEMTSAAAQQGDFEAPFALNLLFGTTGPVLNGLVEQAAITNGHVAAPTTAAGVRSIQGGLIPTDLQPFYTAGVQGFSTFSNSAYYHTTEDTPEHIPPAAHEAVTEFALTFLQDVQNVPPDGLLLREVPTVVVEAPAEVTAGDDVVVTITATQVTGQPVEGIDLLLLVNERDHWPISLEAADVVEPGVWTATVPGDVVREGRLAFTASLNDDLFAAEGYAFTDVLAAGADGADPAATDDPDDEGGLAATGGGALLALLGALGVGGAGVLTASRRRRPVG